MDERARLDDQLQNMRYLYRLRSELDGEKSPRAVIQRARAVMMTVLNGWANAAVCVSFDGQQWEFGDGIQNGLRSYTRAISIAGKERGSGLHCGIELTEGQERALLDETAGQLARTLEARELEMQLLQSATVAVFVEIISALLGLGLIARVLLSVAASAFIVIPQLFNKGQCARCGYAN